MKRRGFLGKILMGVAATAITPMTTLNLEKLQVAPTPDYMNQRVGGVERMRISSSGNVVISA